MIAAPARTLSTPTFTVKEMATRYGVNATKILAWIHRGDLVAIDVSATPGGRPRWRITSEAVAAFEAARNSTPVPRSPRRKRRHENVTEYF